MFLDEALNLDGRAAADVQDADLALLALGQLGGALEVVDQNGDAVAVRLGHGCLDELRVDDLKVGAGALLRVAQQLVDHFIVARITQRLGKGAVDKRCAQQQRMQRGLHKIVVCRDIFRGNGADFILDPGKVLGALGHDGRGQVQKDIRADAPVLVARQHAAHVGLVGPARGFRQERPRLTHRHLVVAANAKAAFPVGDKALRLVGNARHVAAHHVQV